MFKIFLLSFLFLGVKNELCAQLNKTDSLVLNSIYNSSIQRNCNLLKPTKQPFFCALETKIERKTQIPVKFRLGTVQYVDYLENKPNTFLYEIK